MAEWASQAEIAYQDELWIGRTPSGGGAVEWTQIGGIESLPFPEKVPDEIDVTHMQSPGRSRETIPGLLSVGEASLEKQYWPAHEGDILLDELAGLTETGTPEDVLIEFSIDGGARRTYRGRITTFTPSPTVAEKRMVTVVMSVFDRQPTNPRVVAP